MTTPLPRPYPRHGSSAPPDRRQPCLVPACGRPHTHRPRYARHLGSIWPVAQDLGHPDVRLIETWMLETVVRVVATYTRVGQRVLLLAPPTRPGTLSPDRATPGPRTGGGLLLDLIEAAEAASRLGRTLEARTFTTKTAVCTTGDAPPPWPQSVHRLPPE